MKKKMKLSEGFEAAGWNFQTFSGGGGIDTEAGQEGLYPPGVEEKEPDYKGQAPDDPDVVDTKGGAVMLPPMKNQPNSAENIAAVAKNRPVAKDDEHLFPTGINPEE